MTHFIQHNHSLRKAQTHIVTQQDSHTPWSYCLYEHLLHTFILACYFTDRSSAAVLMSWREKRLYNVSLLLVHHAAQSIMDRISHQSTVFWFINTVSLMIQNQTKTQDRAAEWMWSGLCGWGSLCQRRCRRTEFLHCDPQTLLFYCWLTLQGEQSLCYCIWMSIWMESRTNSRNDD